MHSRRLLLATVLLSVPSAALAGPPVVTPKLSPAESVQLYAAAGFRMGTGTMVSTICNQPAMPRVTFVDLGGDGGAEAVAIDKNPACYGQPGDWFTVLRREPNGAWRVILRNVGVVTWESTRSKGWVDARVSGGGQCDRLARFDGADYRQTSDCMAPAAQAAAAQPAPAASANDVTVAERAAILKAAGLTLRGEDWVGCDGNTTASIEKGDVRDLNGDGTLEAIVTERGSACYGNTGQGFYLLTQSGTGAWKVMYGGTGMPEFLATKANGWPELEIGGPGFCFPIERWDGKTYVFNRNHEYEPGACARR
jgi:hypothetical protein